MGAGWSTADIPTAAVKGKRIIVTGANSGIGYHAALELGRGGAIVTIACRSKARGEEALASLHKECPTGAFSLRLLDVSSMADVKRFADEYNAEGMPIDILINNAGIMMPPYELSVDGYESQLATNHLGPFALTGLLMPSLLKSDAPRVVAVASMAAWRVLMRSDEIDFKKSAATYDKIGVYGESKLANLLFTKELAKRYPQITAVSAHPGASSTNLMRYEFGFAKFACQSAASGALPTIRAACEPTVVSGESYYGPRGFGWMGAPAGAYRPPIAKDDAYAAKYWEASVKATGVDY